MTYSGTWTTGPNEGIRKRITRNNPILTIPHNQYKRNTNTLWVFLKQSHLSRLVTENSKRKTAGIDIIVTIITVPR